MENKSTILIVDDEKINIKLALGVFKEFIDEFNIVPVLTGEKALDVVQKQKIDLILLDIMMPDMDGYQVIEKLKSNQDSSKIPVLFITAKTDDHSIEKAYLSGAYDYVTKPFRPIELLSRVRFHLSHSQLVQQLERLASYDVMTNIYNRRKFFESAHQMFDEHNSLIIAVMIDIDKFKIVNDTYGHAFGDKVIKLLASTVSDNLPKDYIFGRIGGEEFAILSYGDDLNKVTDIIEDIRKLIAGLELSNNNEVVKFTMSSGIAEIRPGDDVDHLLQRADEALYEAKESGRNRVCTRILRK
ncbi:MAG: diguanylate cyclase [Gammaproteobacteria bacterium]|nr:diguanylate cyclase [Gammaproteobacteria bacterium]